MVGLASGLPSPKNKLKKKNYHKQFQKRSNSQIEKSQILLQDLKKANK
jgi:hypothetical protein